MKIDDDNDPEENNNTIKRCLSIRSVGMIHKGVRLNSCTCTNTRDQCTFAATNDANGTLTVVNGTLTWKDRDLATLDLWKLMGYDQ